MTTNHITPMSTQAPTTARPTYTNAPLPERKGGYIPTLDGWRAIAVAAVILYHAAPGTLLGHSLQPLQNWGDRGVQLFFAISGLLICSRLLEERRLWGHISLRGFYLRRLFRIQPAAFAYLAAIVLLTLVGILHTSLRANLSALLCYRNYFNALDLSNLPDDRYTGHFWSLAVEEHFYLILPSLLVLSRRRTLPALATLSVLALLWPPIAHQLHLTKGILSAQRTDMALQDLVIPALLAVLLTRPAFRTRLTQLTRHGKLILLVIALIVASERLLGGHLTHQITCLGFPLILASTVLHPTGWLGRLLETPPLLFVGRISYSLYLWQQLFFIHRPDLSVLRHLQVAPWNILAAFACALASYHLVERPMLKLGHRFAPPPTPGRPDLKGDLTTTPPPTPA